MLRAVFTEDGRQRVLESVPVYTIEVTDLRGDDKSAATLKAMREDRSHRVFDPGMLATVRDSRHAAVGSGAPLRRHRSAGGGCGGADHAVPRVGQYSTTIATTRLPAPRGRFVDHVRRLPTPTAAERAYWEARFDTLPSGPDLPRLKLSGPPRFVRRGPQAECAAVAKPENRQRRRRDLPPRP